MTENTNQIQDLSARLDAAQKALKDCKREREELLALADRTREKLAARVRYLEREMGARTEKTNSIPAPPHQASNPQTSGHAPGDAK